MLNPVGRINPKDYTAVTNKDKELLTDDLMKGVEGKGVKYLSSFFKNLTNSGIAKFHRLRTLFESGKWVNNNYVMKKLEKNCTEFNAFLNRYEKRPNQMELREFGRGIEEMRSVCDFLRDKAPNSKKLAKIESELAAIEKKISAQTGTASAQAHAEMVRRAKNEPAPSPRQLPPRPEAAPNQKQPPLKVSEEPKQVPEPVLIARRKTAQPLLTLSKVIDGMPKEVVNSYEMVARSAGALGTNQTFGSYFKNQLIANANTLAANPDYREAVALLKREGTVQFQLSEAVLRDLFSGIPDGIVNSLIPSLVGKPIQLTLDNDRINVQLPRPSDLQVIPGAEARKAIAGEGTVEKRPARVVLDQVLTQVGDEVRQMVATARKEPGFTNSLGQVIGGLSADNRRLNELAATNYDKLKRQDVEGCIEETVDLVLKGFVQQDKNAPASIKESIGRLETLKNEFHEALEGMRLADADSEAQRVKERRTGIESELEALRHPEGKEALRRAGIKQRMAVEHHELAAQHLEKVVTNLIEEKGGLVEKLLTLKEKLETAAAKLPEQFKGDLEDRGPFQIGDYIRQQYKDQEMPKQLVEMLGEIDFYVSNLDGLENAIQKFDVQIDKIRAREAADRTAFASRVKEGLDVFADAEEEIFEEAEAELSRSVDDIGIETMTSEDLGFEPEFAKVLVAGRDANEAFRSFGKLLIKVSKGTHERTGKLAEFEGQPLLDQTSLQGVLENVVKGQYAKALEGLKQIVNMAYNAYKIHHDGKLPDFVQDRLAILEAKLAVLDAAKAALHAADEPVRAGMQKLAQKREVGKLIEGYISRSRSEPDARSLLTRWIRWDSNGINDQLRKLQAVDCSGLTKAQLKSHLAEVIRVVGLGLADKGIVPAKKPKDLSEAEKRMAEAIEAL